MAKKYAYWVSFRGENFAYGDCYVTSKTKLNTWERIQELRKEMQQSKGLKTVIIINFVKLKKSR